MVSADETNDPAGRVVKWYKTNTDIEDRKWAEALLTGENRRLEMLARGESLEHILNGLCRLVDEVSGDSTSSILLLDPVTNQLWHGAAPNLPQVYIDAVNGLTAGPCAGSCGTSAYRGEPVIVADTLTDPLWMEYRHLALTSGMRACWSSPIFSSTAQVLGTFAIYSHEPRRPTERHQHIIEQITHLASVAIERSRTEAELRRSVTGAKQAQQQLEQALSEIRTLKDRLQQENVALREEIDKTSMFEEIVGASPALRALLLQIAKVAPTDSTVLITGETGTGKELVARAIHKRSPRAARPFVSVNCAAIPGALIASELFGHEKGAFTGAVHRRQGRFELAEGGTLFIDEVGELPAETQVALLRVLQEHEFELVGGGRPIQADARIIAATNRDLQGAVADGSLRTDLFYRLNVFPVEVPPLRHRPADIPLLVEYFVHRYTQRAGKRIHGISKKTLAQLQAYHWPGNVRELQNIVERAVIVSDKESLYVDERWLSGAPARQVVAVPRLPARALHERDSIEAALAEAQGRVSGPFGAAAKLGMPSSTLESKIKALNIDKRRFKGPTPLESIGPKRTCHRPTAG
ncbi:MAG: GAF domain-containing protein [Luteitalea sp.]|nr:GAF domain-containing protein [Luteitalea sp.]